MTGQHGIDRVDLEPVDGGDGDHIGEVGELADCQQRLGDLLLGTLSVFVTSATIGVRPSRSSSCEAMYRSPGPMGSSAGRQKPMTSTSLSVEATRSLRRLPSSVRGLWSPGVSTRISW